MDDAKTVWVGNIADQVTEELLYELFLQAGPLERVKIPMDREGRKSTYGFITFKHEVSVPYVVQLLNGVKLFDKTLNIKPRNGGAQANFVQRSFSYPNESPSFLSQQSPHNAGGMGTHSYEDLVRFGQMMATKFDYSDNNYDYGGNFGPNRHQNDRSRERRDFERSRNNYDRENDRRPDYSRNRNHRGHDRKNNFDRNSRKRHNRFY